MEYKELIESGKLELFALGALEGQEKKEIESLLEENKELREEYDQIVAALHQYGNAVSEPADISILEKAKARIDNNIEEEQVVSHPAAKPKSNPFKWLSIAASVLLIFSVAMNFQFNKDLQALEQEVLALEAEQSQIAARTVELNEALVSREELIADISSGEVIRTYMGSTPSYNGYESTVFWNKVTSEVILATNNLPALSANEQYQLWAIVDGKPVDAGVFDSENKLLNMKPIQGEAAAFAVTIEPKGGSVDPTLEKMCMMGNVSG
ncbi:anti-sigma factor [bacterium]|nr:anti-sigma factor [bacterium]